jgi:hypothetical protein
MKSSDSKNSLADLNPPEEICFVCMGSREDSHEPLVISSILRTCGCKFHVHPSCWNQWMRDKTDYDCPICRRESLLRIRVPPNPVLMMEVPQEVPRARNYQLYIYLAVCIVVATLLGIAFTLLFKKG